MSRRAISHRLSALGYWLLAIGLPVSGHAQQVRSPLPDSRFPVADSGSSLTVTLLTYDTGEKVWERFGHNALWIHDARTGENEHYDYGRFDFGQPNFVLRFLQGRMWYSMGYESNVAGMLALYASQGRRIWAQELDLAPAEKLALRRFLAWNIQPENAPYAYDYYRDNCSTRVRDALDRVLGGALRSAGATGSGMTWREETRRLNQHNVWLYTGLLLLLGQPVDREMTRWEQTFLPVRLRELVSSVQVPGPDGTVRPLVKAERVLEPGGRWPTPERPASWTWRYLLVGVALGGLLFALGRTRAFLPVATLWALLAGIAGALLTWLWLASHHVAAYRNENLLLFNLLALALAVTLPSALRRRSWALSLAPALARLVAGLALVALLLKVLPWFRQHNPELLALALPVHLGLAGGLGRALRRAPAPAPMASAPS